MRKGAYYNEIDKYCVEWLKNLIKAGHIPAGDVDDRSIVDVRPDDLRGYQQAHFFAGLGGWAYAARLAGWPDDRPLWTGSCPCQPFSTAGKQRGLSDERHLWPVWFPLIRECRPLVVAGEQVPAAIAKGWLDLVFDDLEGEDYACWATIVPALGAGAPHRRNRIWYVADATGNGWQQRLAAATAARHGRELAAAGGADTAANAVGDQLRIEPGRRSGPDGEGPAVSRDDGEAQSVAYAYGSVGRQEARHADTDGREFGPRACSDGAGQREFADGRAVADDAVERAAGKFNSRGEPKLSAQVRLWPTPTHRDHRSGVNHSCWNNARPLSEMVGGLLNPMWVAWLMGYPPEWLSCAPSETPSSRKSARKSLPPTLQAMLG